MLEPAQSRLRQFTVMIVEDDEIMRKLIGDVLIRLGFNKIVRAGDAHSGLALLEQRPIDFIISDWRMHGMDGVTFTKTIRNSGQPYAMLPIIMLSGNAEKHQIIEARDAGVNLYLVKPFTINNLCQHIGEIIENPREHIVSSVYKGPSRRRKKAPRPPIGERRKRNIQPQ